MRSWRDRKRAWIKVPHPCLTVHGARIQVRADCLNVHRRRPGPAVQSALSGLAATDVVGSISRRVSQSGLGPDWIKFWGLDDPNGRHTDWAGVERLEGNGTQSRAVVSRQPGALPVGGAGSASSSPPTTAPKPARHALVGRPRRAPMSRS
jgi:hypothetical protein